MASLYPTTPQPARRVQHGTVSTIGAGAINVSTGYGTTINAPSLMPGYIHAGSSALIIAPDGDGQAPVVLGQSGYATP